MLSVDQLTLFSALKFHSNPS